MTTLIRVFQFLAVAGLLALFIVHAAALTGNTQPFAHYLKFLGPGIFVVWLPTIFVMNRLTRDFKQKDIWRAALRGCPTWMRRAVWCLFGYSWVGFFILPMLFGGGMESEANKARSMSAVLMMFYTIAAAVMFSALHAKRADTTRRCMNGHTAQPLAKFCEECGAPVLTQESSDN